MGSILSMFSRAFLRPWLHLALSVWLGCSAFAAQAFTTVASNSLHEARLVVADTSEAARKAGFAQGLSQVILRITGRQSTLDVPAVRAMISQAESLVQSYGYEALTSEADVNDVSAPEAAMAQRVLRVNFDENGLDQALVAAEVAIWRDIRPQLLVWAISDTQGDRLLATADSDWAAAWERASRRRALPLLLPTSQALNDSGLTPSEIWGQFMDAITAASRAYTHDVLAVVAVNHRPAADGGMSADAMGSPALIANEIWSARWRLQGNGVSAAGQLEATGRELLTQQLVDVWTERLADVYAITAGETLPNQAFALQVSNVHNFLDYVAVQKALKDMAPVNELLLTEVAADRVGWTLIYTGAPSTLAQYLQRDKRFQPVIAGDIVDIPQFRWTPAAK